MRWRRRRTRARRASGRGCGARFRMGYRRRRRCWLRRPEGRRANPVSNPSPSPHSKPSPVPNPNPTLVKAGEEACQRVDEARLLAWLLPLRPRLVTIARSVDGFLPFHCTARIEAAVLRVLAAAAASFNASLRVEHLPGTATGAALQAMTDRPRCAGAGGRRSVTARAESEEACKPWEMRAGMFFMIMCTLITVLH